MTKTSEFLTADEIRILEHLCSINMISLETMEAMLENDEQWQVSETQLYQLAENMRMFVYIIDCLTNRMDWPGPKNPPAQG